MARRTRIVGPLLGLIVGVVLVIGVLASRSQEDRVGNADARPAQDREAEDIDVRITADGPRPRSAEVGRGKIVQWRNETTAAVRLTPASGVLEVR